MSSIFLIWTYFPLILQWKTILFFLQPVIVIKKDLTILNVTMKMDSAPATQTFLALSVINVLMDFMDFQNVKVGFCYQYFWNKYIYLSFFNKTLYWFFFTDNCDCNKEGSNDTKCDNENGQCSCKSNIFGIKCEKCVEGLYGFPKCQGRFLLSIFLKQIYFPLILQ